MIAVRCAGCGRLLGWFEGKGKMKCPKVKCGAITEFDTSTMVKTKKKCPDMKHRNTSSGVTFS